MTYATRIARLDTNEHPRIRKLVREQEDLLQAWASNSIATHMMAQAEIKVNEAQQLVSALHDPLPPILREIREKVESQVTQYKLLSIASIPVPSTFILDGRKESSEWHVIAVIWDKLQDISSALRLLVHVVQPLLIPWSLEAISGRTSYTNS